MADGPGVFFHGVEYINIHKLFNKVIGLLYYELNILNALGYIIYINVESLNALKVKYSVKHSE